jgi:cytochrome bd ubiquinol oxidase subunit II
MMDLNSLCFVLFGILFLTFLLLEGFDYGVGMLLPFLGKSEAERQAIVQTLAPVWEGNQVWLIAAGVVLFAGFPEVYATLFSGLYLALLLILVTLIPRGVGFEFRAKHPSPHWRKFWDWAIFCGSIVPAFLWGVAVADLLYGLPIDGELQYAGTFASLLSLYSLSGGLVFLLLFLLHGAAYLALRLEDSFLPQVRKLGLHSAKYALAAAAIFVALTLLYTDATAKPAAVLFLGALLLALRFCHVLLGKGLYVPGFILNTAAIIALIAAIFISLFPRFIVSSLNPAWSLTIYNSASNPLTLKIMSTAIILVLPIIALFEGWKYYLFSEKTVAAADRETRRIAWNRLQERLRQLITHLRQLAALLEKWK